MLLDYPLQKDYIPKLHREVQRLILLFARVFQNFPLICAKKFRDVLRSNDAWMCDIMPHLNACDPFFQCREANFADVCFVKPDTLDRSAVNQSLSGKSCFDVVNTEGMDLAAVEQLSREVLILEMLKSELLERNSRLEHWHAQHPHTSTSQSGCSKV